MASCSLGASNIKLVNLDFGRARVGNIQPHHSVKVLTGHRHLQHPGLVLSKRAGKSLAQCSGSSTEIESALKLGNGCDETTSSGLISQLIPNSFEVESLLTNICDTTSIAEFELKVGGFHLYVKRDITEQVTPSPPSPAPVSIEVAPQIRATESPVSTSVVAISKPGPSSGSIQTFLDKSADEGLAILQSPRVGYFRRARTIKGKRVPPPCKENQIVKEGQVLCYIEQLGGELPIESDVSGEVIKILRKDGDPVGYGDALIAILPSFPGIKKLQ